MNGLAENVEATYPEPPLPSAIDVLLYEKQKMVRQITRNENAIEASRRDVLSLQAEDERLWRMIQDYSIAIVKLGGEA